MKKILLLSLFTFTTLAGHADEGMWMLTDLKEQNAATMYDMGLDISIDKVYCPDSISLKDAVVHFGGGCTGEIISAEGLVLTNHHCGYSYIQQHSSVEHDYLTDGFWAMSRKEELPCKGLTVTFIDRILDVTPYVKEQLAKDEDPEGLNYLSPSYLSKVAIYIMYSTTTAFLYFASMQEASAGAMLAVNDDVRPEQVVFLPQDDIQSVVQTRSVDVVGTALYNYTDGYGTYLIPAVLMVVIFQTLIFVISMLSGKERETGDILMFAGPEGRDLSFLRMASVVIGKSFTYLVFYALFSVFLLGLLPLVFQLPHLAYPWKIVALMIPYILATSFFGLACSLFFSDSDAPLLLVAFFSVGLIFLSGVSYPLELMPWYWQWIHYMVPAAPGTLAFVKINSMGASMSEISQQYIILWIQCAIYFVLACRAYRYNIKKAKCERQ